MRLEVPAVYIWVSRLWSLTRREARHISVPLVRVRAHGHGIVVAKTASQTLQFSFLSSNILYVLHLGALAVGLVGGLVEEALKVGLVVELDLGEPAYNVSGHSVVYHARLLTHRRRGGPC